MRRRAQGMACRQRGTWRLALWLAALFAQSPTDAGCPGTVWYYDPTSNYRDNIQGHGAGVAMSADGVQQTILPLVSPANIRTSNDGGESWTEVSGTNKNWVAASLAVSSDGTRQIAGTSDDYLWVSTDAGITWVQDTGLGPNVQHVAMSSDGAKQTAINYTSGTAGHIYVSHDSGATWSKGIPDTSPDDARGWRRVAMSNDGLTQAAVERRNIWASSDSGATWSTVLSVPSINFFRGLAVSSDGAKQTALAMDGNPYISNDSGTTWTEISNTQAWREVSMSDDGATQTAITRDGSSGSLWTSQDSGATWTQAVQVAPESDWALVGLDRPWYDIAMSADGSVQTAVSYHVGIVRLTCLPPSSPPLHPPSPPPPPALPGSGGQLSALEAATDGLASFGELRGAWDVATFTLDTSTYAIVAASSDDGVQLINVSNPSNPVAVGHATDEANGFKVLGDPRGVATFVVDTKVFAIVTARQDNGVQLINVTDPSNPVAVAFAVDGSDGFEVLRRPTDVATFTIGDSTFAIVASQVGDGVQLIDVSDPNNPVAVGHATDEANGFTELNGPMGVATFTIGDSTFAIVASQADDGVQLINVTDPSNPVAKGSATDEVNGFTVLDGAQQVATFTIGTSTYAVVTALFDDGVQLIDVSDPDNPVAVGNATDEANGFTELDGAYGVATFTDGARSGAVVGGRDDKSVTLMGVSDPSNPVAVDAVIDGFREFAELQGIRGITTFTISGEIYAIAASNTDHGVQLMRVELYASPSPPPSPPYSPPKPPSTPPPSTPPRPTPRPRMQPPQCVILADGSTRCIQIPEASSLDDAMVQRNILRRFGSTLRPNDSSR